MSRGPKSSPLFGMAEELAKKSAFSLSLLSQLFFSSFFILFSSSDLLHLLFLNFSFARAGKKSCKRKRLFHVRCRPAASGRWKSSAQEAVAQELAGSSGSFYFFGWFEVLACFFTFEGYRAQTPCDLYSLLLVISYHPPASYWGRSVFY